MSNLFLLRQHVQPALHVRLHLWTAVWGQNELLLGPDLKEKMIWEKFCMTIDGLCSSVMATVILSACLN